MIEPARALIVACAIGIGSFVASFLSSIMAIKLVALAIEASTEYENCPFIRRVDYALKKIVVDVMPSAVRYIEQYLPSIIVPGHDEEWPIFMRYPYFGMVSVFGIVFGLYLALSGLRIVKDAVERRNEAEARRMQAEEERRKTAIADC